MKDMTWIKTNLITHRGLHSDSIPENSIEAFIEATNNGYDIELDLQLTKDDKIIVFHDDNLSRLCGVNKNISSLTHAELKECKQKETSFIIPLFKDVLDSIPPSTNLMVELKTSRKNKRLVSLFLEIIKQYNFQYVVQSFDPRIVRILRKKAPSVCRGYITKDRPTNCNFINAMSKILPIHSWIKPDYYVYKLKDLPNKKMDKYKSQGIPILSYTATSQQELDFVKEQYDNAVFEGFRPRKEES